MSEPMQDSEPNLPPHTPNSGSNAGIKAGSKPFVLVIDDSCLERASIRKTLENEFTIIEAENGKDGWEKLIAEPRVQVVITDTGMPRLDSFEIIARIRENDITRINSVPVIMITGADSSDTRVREKAFSLGVTDFITKPFDKTQLLARVHSHTRLDQTQRTLENTEETLAEQSVIDLATNMHNRRYFLQRGEQNTAFAKRHNQGLSIIVVGIDNFSQLEQQYGDEVAIQLLSWAASMISDVNRKENIVARVDHARFAIIAPSAGRMEANKLCERIRKHFQTKKYTESTLSLHVTVSLGLGCFEEESSESIDDMLALTEARVIKAHKLGGNRIIADDENTSPKKKLPTSPSIDFALAQIQSGKTEKLHPFIILLARRVFPILEECNTKLDWKLDEHIALIKTKLNHQ